MLAWYGGRPRQAAAHTFEHCSVAGRALVFAAATACLEGLEQEAATAGRAGRTVEGIQTYQATGSPRAI